MMYKGEWLGERTRGNSCAGRCSSRVVSVLILIGGIAALGLAGGCTGGAQFISPEARKPIDRKLVEYPGGFVLETVARGISAGTSIAFVNDEGEYKGSLLVAESGNAGSTPRIYGWKPDGTYFSVYPRGRQIPTIGGLLPNPGSIYAPIGGMVFTQGRIYITHRDARGNGVVSSLGFDGSIQTVVADLPAQGDYGMTDIAAHPNTGRLWFGVGAATNSGVVGIDNWQVGWVRKHPEVCDLPHTGLKLLGFKFFTRNPTAGLFGGDDNVETAPFQPFGKNNQLRIAKAASPNAAIYSVSPSGGDARPEAFGIRYPRGIAFNQWGTPYATNDGMELRGTRPVKNDPDVLLKIIQGTWYGWPDFSADLLPISDPRFLEPMLIIRTGYPELSFLIDHAASALVSPAEYRDTLLWGIFPSLSGAAKLDFVPDNGGAFRDYRGSAIVALNGDRAPFATSGQKLKAPVGYKIVRVGVDVDPRRVEDFIHNTENLPASKLNTKGDALERPIDVKFGPDGKLYILDYGRMEMRGGKEKATPGTGKIFVLQPARPPATRPVE